MDRLNPKSFMIEYLRKYYDSNQYVYSLVFSEKQAKSNFKNISLLRDDIKTLSKFYVGFSYQEWFCESYPDLIDMVINLTPGIKVKYSHVELGNKFGVFSND
jgi:hypothetical protein